MSLTYWKPLAGNKIDKKLSCALIFCQQNPSNCNVAAFLQNQVEDISHMHSIRLVFIQICFTWLDPSVWEFLIRHEYVIFIERRKA